MTREKKDRVINLDLAINQRLNDKEWDRKMALLINKKRNENILNSKNRTTKKRVILISLSAALAAASLLFVLSPSNKVNSAQDLDKWISLQVEGTYNSVFSKKSIKNEKNYTYSDSFIDEDSIISDALNMR